MYTRSFNIATDSQIHRYHPTILLFLFLDLNIQSGPKK